MLVSWAWRISFTHSSFMSQTASCNSETDDDDFISLSDSPLSFFLSLAVNNKGKRTSPILFSFSVCWFDLIAATTEKYSVLSFIRYRYQLTLWHRTHCMYHVHIRPSLAFIMQSCYYISLHSVQTLAFVHLLFELLVPCTTFKSLPSIFLS